MLGTWWVAGGRRPLCTAAVQQATPACTNSPPSVCTAAQSLSPQSLLPEHPCSLQPQEPQDQEDGGGWGWPGAPLPAAAWVWREACTKGLCAPSGVLLPVMHPLWCSKLPRHTLPQPTLPSASFWALAGPVRCPADFYPSPRSPLPPPLPTSPSASISALTGPVRHAVRLGHGAEGRGGPPGQGSGAAGAGGGGAQDAGGRQRLLGRLG